MDLESPEVWRWLWLGGTAFFAIAELAIPTNFFLASFAAGALVATVLAFLDVVIEVQWGAFVGVSVVSLFALRPLSRRLDRDAEGVSTSGADRWVGRPGVVLAEVPGGAGETGRVRVEREEWRAESADGDRIAVDARVIVVRVDGTRMVVRRTGDAPGHEHGPGTERTP